MASIALLACSKMGIAKKTFLSVMAEASSKKTPISVSKIKATQCYSLIKKRVKSMLSSIKKRAQMGN